jgi:hypothetical protein
VDLIVDIGAIELGFLAGYAGILMTDGYSA